MSTDVLTAPAASADRTVRASAVPDTPSRLTGPRATTPYVRWFEHITKADVAVVGGKGANLGELTRAGFPVPPGFVVTVDAYRRTSEAIQTLVRDAYRLHLGESGRHRANPAQRCRGGASCAPRGCAPSSHACSVRLVCQQNH